MDFNSTVKFMFRYSYWLYIQYLIVIFRTGIFGLASELTNPVMGFFIIILAGAGGVMITTLLAALVAIPVELLFSYLYRKIRGRTKSRRRSRKR